MRWVRKEYNIRLVVIAPAYNGYRHTLLSVQHDINLPYPVEVYATTFGFPDQDQSASSDEQLQDLVGKILRSEETRATILSLIAKSNEAKLAPSGSAT